MTSGRQKWHGKSTLFVSFVDVYTEFTVPVVQVPRPLTEQVNKCARESYRNRVLNFLLRFVPQNIQIWCVLGAFRVLGIRLLSTVDAFLGNRIHTIWQKICQEGTFSALCFSGSYGFGVIDPRSWSRYFHNMSAEVTSSQWYNSRARFLNGVRLLAANLPADFAV